MRRAYVCSDCGRAATVIRADGSDAYCAAHHPDVLSARLADFAGKDSNRLAFLRYAVPKGVTLFQARASPGGKQHLDAMRFASGYLATGLSHPCVAAVTNLLAAPEKRKGPVEIHEYETIAELPVVRGRRDYQRSLDALRPSIFDEVVASVLRDEGAPATYLRHVRTWEAERSVILRAPFIRGSSENDGDVPTHNAERLAKGLPPLRSPEGTYAFPAAGPAAIEPAGDPHYDRDYIHMRQFRALPDPRERALVTALMMLYLASDEVHHTGVRRHAWFFYGQGGEEVALDPPVVYMSGELLERERMPLCTGFVVAYSNIGEAVRKEYQLDYDTLLVGCWARRGYEKRVYADLCQAIETSCGLPPRVEGRRQGSILGLPFDLENAGFPVKQLDMAYEFIVTE